MGLQGGNLLINRQRVTLPAGVTQVDTGIIQADQATAPDPPLGGTDNLVASRVMVIPLAPLSAWTNIIHDEPQFEIDGADTIQVRFSNSGAEVTLNVLFLNPYTSSGPVDADPYNMGTSPIVDFVSINSTFSAQV